MNDIMIHVDWLLLYLVYILLVESPLGGRALLLLSLLLPDSGGSPCFDPVGVGRRFRLEELAVGRA